MVRLPCLLFVAKGVNLFSLFYFFEKIYLILYSKVAKSGRGLYDVLRDIRRNFVSEQKIKRDGKNPL